MKIHEYQAKELISRYGVEAPRNAGVVTTPQVARGAVERRGGRGVLKRLPSCCVRSAEQ